jgi:hypothetical protein
MPVIRAARLSRSFIIRASEPLWRERATSGSVKETPASSAHLPFPLGTEGVSFFTCERLAEAIRDSLESFCQFAAS